MEADRNARLKRALLSLEGLSVGDGLGERFFFQGTRARPMIARRELPARRWDYTDDTRMALSIVAILHEHDEINQDALAQHFAKLYAEDPGRAYGPAMRDLLADIHFGADWREAAPALFGGKGSFGNGAAMRIAPLGAYFADDLERVVIEAERSAVVTHAHPEAAAGAIAVALAAALALRSRDEEAAPDWRAFIDQVLPHIPNSAVRDTTQIARDLPDDAGIDEVVARIGNGVRHLRPGHRALCPLVRRASPARFRGSDLDGDQRRWRRRHHCRHGWRHRCASRRAGAHPG